MARESETEHTIYGTVPEGEWMRFFKEHFKPVPHGGSELVEEARKTTGSCEDYGCPKSHPISGTKLTGCTVEISGGRVVGVNCHYEPVRKA